MKNEIDSLKYAVFSEWSYNPPTRRETLYFDVYSTAFEELLKPIAEIFDHLSYMVYDEEYDELEKIHHDVKATKESIQNYCWDNGGLGCDCVLIAEGKAIAKICIFFRKIHNGLHIRTKSAYQ